MTSKIWIQRLATTLVLAITSLAPALPARADDAPKPPADTPAANEPRRSGPGIARLAENLSKLDLSADQQEKVKALLDDLRKQMQAFREDAGNTDRQATAEKARDLFSGIRAKLHDILTPDQQEKLRDLMQQQPAGPPGGPVERPKQPDEQPKAAPADPPKPMAMQDGGGKKDHVVAAPPPPVQPTNTVEIGQPAPDFSLKSTSDKPTALAGLKGRVVVLVFGSYSTPSFREKLPALEKLAGDYNTRATFLIVYTREAHAVGEWEVDRNKDESISVEQPKTAADRLALAKQAVSTLKITLPVLIDGMDDAVAKSYGLLPNGAVVINRDGTVAARQHWFEPIGLKQQIDNAVAVPNPKN